MTELRVAVPDEELRDLLADAAKASVFVWTPDDGAPPGPIDLLVLPYMVGPPYLRKLDGHPVRVVQSQMLGYEQPERHLPPGMTYCNAVEVHEASTAELVAALVLSCQRGLPGFRDAQWERRWDHRTTPGLAGARIVVIGAGGVGMKIAQVLMPFDVDVTLIARSTRGSAYGEIRAMSDLPQVLPEADVVVLAVPLTEETRGLANASFLSLMADGALLVNVARGAVVDTPALVSELQSRRIRAALDVTDPEPLPTEHPLWRAPGVLITPHVGGDTGARLPRIERIVREQLRRMQTNDTLLNVVVEAGR